MRPHLLKKTQTGYGLAMNGNSGFDSALLQRASDEVGRSVVALVREEPFFGHLLQSMNRDISNRTHTAAVSFRNGRPLLSVNPEFFIEQVTRKKERTAIIKHEVLHLLFDHLGKFDSARMNRKVFNLAADVVVNQFIGRKWSLPAGAVTLDSFDFYLPPDQTVDWYYEKLISAASEVEIVLVSHCDVSHWDSHDDDASDSIGRYELARIIRDARVRSGDRFYATTPSPIVQMVDAFIEELEPTVDWRRVLRMFSNSSRQSRITNTLRRPSKRYGTFPGIQVKRHHHIAVILDTSGSISDEDLSDFFGEVRGIWRQGSEVFIIEADQVVQNTWAYSGQEPPSSIGGRGGTSFDPALNYVANATQPFDAAIYLTDGHAATPTVLPRCKVLWVLSENGSDSALGGHKTVQITR